MESELSLGSLLSRPETLCYARVLASAYVNGSAISATNLSMIEKNIKLIAASGKKMIFRLVYSNDALGIDPVDIFAVSNLHLGQMKTLLETHKAALAFVQAGIIGSNGEWWGSTNGHDTNSSSRAAAVNALHVNLPTYPCIKVQIIRPDYMLLLGTPPSMPSPESQCTIADRLGHHNDRWLASDMDAKDQSLRIYQNGTRADNVAALNMYMRFLFRVFPALISVYLA
jgi:hypothetical protein